MKQLLIFVCIAFCSCNAVKKITNKTQTFADSTGAKSSLLIDVKKKDTTGTTSTATANKRTSDSSYNRTTTIVREYYSDEFSLGADTQDKSITTGIASFKAVAKNLAKPQAKPGLKLKEVVTINESGTLQAIENAAMLQDHTAQIKDVDSSVVKDTQVSQNKTNQAQSKSFKLSFSLFPWWAWLILAAAIALLIYLRINPFSFFIRKK